MTVLLEKAFSKASELPTLEQNRFAQWVLDELEDEKRWDKLFAESGDVLSLLADEALAEHKQNKTRPIDEILR